MTSSREQRLRYATLDRSALEQLQLERLNRSLARAANNPLYRRKFASCPKKVESLAQYAQFPFTSKDELLPSGSRAMPTNLTFPIESYTRFHQTSGTRGRPLPVCDTPEDWQAWIDVWQYMLDAANIGPQDRVLLAFSFGPFIGFWSAFDALIARGAMAIPGGGLSSLARLDLIDRTRATSIFCTPSYALHLVEVAADNKIHLPALGLKSIVVAGEPGGSVPVIREKIESAWQTRLVDHAGASEIGPWGFGDAEGTGVHVVESDFIAEFLAVETGQPAEEGELSHLVLTTLRRPGAPVFRYRTGDLVRPMWPREGACRFVRLDGGIEGRADDMLVVRGVNIFPSSIEQILRSFPEVIEYRMTARKRGALDDVLIEVEDHQERPERIARELEKQLGLKILVDCVPILSLPRFEGKGRRFIDERS